MKIVIQNNYKEKFYLIRQASTSKASLLNNQICYHRSFLLHFWPEISVFVAIHRQVLVFCEFLLCRDCIFWCCAFAMKFIIIIPLWRDPISRFNSALLLYEKNLWILRREIMDCCLKFIDVTLKICMNSHVLRSKRCEKSTDGSSKKRLFRATKVIKNYAQSQPFYWSS